MATTPRVISVNCDDEHRFTKPRRESITLVAGRGVEGDAHFGETVQHLSRVRRDPSQPNLRQVHLIHAELFEDVTAQIAAGELGENVTTRGVDLLGLPRGARLRLGPDAVVEVTGLRNPCQQIDRFAPGLLKEVVGTDAEGRTIRKTGVMAVVVTGGVVRPGDPIGMELPERPFEPLLPV